VHTLRRAFPGVRIVAAALDPTLTEVHFPLLTGVSGHATGDAEYAARLVARGDAMSDADEGIGGAVVQDKVKVAWVVQPGMGHIGDRYYLD
jgi:uridine kinase